MYITLLRYFLLLADKTRQMKMSLWTWVTLFSPLSDILKTHQSEIRSVQKKILLFINNNKKAFKTVLLYHTCFLVQKTCSCCNEIINIQIFIVWLTKCSLHDWNSGQQEQRGYLATINCLLNFNYTHSYILVLIKLNLPHDTVFTFIHCVFEKSVHRVLKLGLFWACTLFEALGKMMF